MTEIKVYKTIEISDRSFVKRIKTEYTALGEEGTTRYFKVDSSIKGLMDFFREKYELGDKITTPSQGDITVHERDGHTIVDALQPLSSFEMRILAIELYKAFRSK